MIVGQVHAGEVAAEAVTAFGGHTLAPSAGIAIIRLGCVPAGQQRRGTHDQHHCCFSIKSLTEGLGEHF